MLLKKSSITLGGIEKFDIILGKAFNDELVTLVNCISGYTISESGMPISILTAELAIIGAHFKNKEEILFSNVDAILFQLRTMGIYFWI